MGVGKGGCGPPGISLVKILFKQLTSLHVPKIRFVLAILFERVFFFFESSSKNGFPPVESPFFCVGQKKKHLKRTSKKNRCFGTCKLAKCPSKCLNRFEFCFSIFTTVNKFRILFTPVLISD